MGSPVPSLESEFSGADLGDLRRTKRLQKIAELAAANPSLGFPRQAGTSGVLEGTYRFLNNPSVTAERVLSAHTEKVVERASDVGKVLVLHDTTQFLFGGDEDRDGLGRASDSGKQGFLAHVSFAVSEDGMPLGTLAIASVTAPVRTDCCSLRSHAPPSSDASTTTRPRSATWDGSAVRMCVRPGTPSSPTHVSISPSTRTTASTSSSGRPRLLQSLSVRSSSPSAKRRRPADDGSLFCDVSFAT